MWKERGNNLWLENAILEQLCRRGTGCHNAGHIGRRVRTAQVIRFEQRHQGIILLG